MNMTNSSQNSNLIAFALITSLFFMWGLANNMTDTLLAAFKKIMSMSDFQTSWIQIAFYGSYFCLALPAAFIIKRYSYKSGILIGLGMAILGSLLFYPASVTMAYHHFLIALFIFAGGLAILETTANPYILELGSALTAVRRLNFAQSFNPIGSIMGVVLSKFFILSHLNEATTEERFLMNEEQLESIQRVELEAVMGPYIAVAFILMIIWIMIYYKKMPFGRDVRNTIQLKPLLKRLFNKQHYVFGVITQFFYVGAQIGIWSFTIRYVIQELKVNESEAATWYMSSLILFMGFRFIFTFLMKYTLPKHLLMGAAATAILLTVLTMTNGGIFGVISLLSISACMSLMFPTIYGLALEDLGEDTKLAASGLVMAILGGAALTALQGYISDQTGNIQYSFVVPLFCFVIVAIYGIFTDSGKKTIEG
jgi:MFS transporter, FHS family, L-fucose permease